MHDEGAYAQRPTRGTSTRADNGAAPALRPRARSSFIAPVLTSRYEPPQRTPP